MPDQKIVINITTLIDKVVIVNTNTEASLEELKNKVKDALVQAVESATKVLNQETPK